MYILFLLFSVATAFACQNDAIVISRSTGFGWGSNGDHAGSTHQKVNVPVLYEGKWGCWVQEGGLSFEVKEKSRKMTVILPKATIQDLPARATSYAMLRNENGSVQMDIANFICLGDHVLSSETFSGSATEARMLQELDGQISSVFATGAAAANLSRQREEIARRLGRSSDLPGGLQDYFEENYQGSFTELENYEIFVPSIYLGTNMSSPLSKLSSSYHTRVLTKSACSPQFESIMAPYRLDQLKLPVGIKAKLKKGNLLLSW